MKPVRPQPTARRTRCPVAPWVWSAALVIASGTSAAAQPNPLASRALAEEPTARVLVHLAPSAARGETVEQGTGRLRTVVGRAGVELAGARPLTARLHVVYLPHVQRGAELADTLDALRGDGEVLQAEPDRRKHALAMPSDTDFPNQWYWAATYPAAVNMEATWDITTGSTGTVIAVLDTGVRFDHPDLGRASSGGRLLAGYDFVGPDSTGTFLTANDGDGWDADPSDPGDWITKTDLSQSVFSSCTVSDSSWHGTRTAGLIGALTNNALGIAGGTWKPWLVPVRVLGKCGGFDSDIEAGMLWAGGISVAGAPKNPYPANIENLSLGGTSACGTYQPVIDELAAQGVLVVVSAGNDGNSVGSPANCKGVVAVAGLRHVGTKVGYSDLGPEITLSAPAGNCGDAFVNGGPCLYSIDTTTNLGTTTPAANGYTDQVNSNLGTSFSAPIVTAIAGLMHAENANLTPAQFIARLQEGTTPFPTTSADATTQPAQCIDPAQASAAQNSECICTTAVCGAGMANALGAVHAAQRPIAAVEVQGTVSAGQTVTLDASASAAACGRSISSYAWSVAPGGALSSTNGSQTTLTAPASGKLTVHLVVTDDAGRSDAADVSVTPSAASSTAPQSAGTRACPAAIDPNAKTPATTPTPSSGGGGGALGVAELSLLALAAGRRHRRARSFRSPR